LFRRIKQHFPHSLPALVLAVLGISAAMVALNYGVGSFTHMGPGFIPMMLGIVLVLLSGVILWHEINLPETWIAPSWRPFIAITLGILAWAGLAESAGFFIAAAAQIILSSLALPNPRWRSILILVVVLSSIGYFLFVMQLGVPLEALG
jgi:hypothetical protein